MTLKPVVVPGGIGPYKWRDRRLIEALTADGSIPLILDAGDELLEAAAAERLDPWRGTGSSRRRPTGGCSPA